MRTLPCLSRELLEEYRTAQEKDTLAARNMRKSFNKNAYTHALVQPAAFASNSASAKKELRELELARTLNELYLCGLLTQDCNEAKELLTMHDGQAAAALARVLSKPIIDKVLPGACGTEGTLTNFDTERTKAKSEYTLSHPPFVPLLRLPRRLILKSFTSQSYTITSQRQRQRVIRLQPQVVAD